MAKTSGTSDDENIGTKMDDVENKNTDINSDKHPITEHQDIDHLSHSMKAVT